MPETILHKHEPQTQALVSIILLDWSVREYYQALEWLCHQDVPRESYELIWIDLYDRVPDEALQVADVVITCQQRGRYHKHKGYNTGLLHSSGKIVCVCDSDAIFPDNFITSIIRAFEMNEKDEPKTLVLMHYQWRTKSIYPGSLSSLAELKNYTWADLWPNAGACMSVAKRDAIRFGGFDEHASYYGYMCGPYDLGWRLVNAGIPELWHESDVALWHFAHPDPVASFGQHFSFKLWRENSYPHLKGHALSAVEAFSTGRMLPLLENKEIHRMRMAQRVIGTMYEEQYANLTGPCGFSKRQLLGLHILFRLSFIAILYMKLRVFILENLHYRIGSERYLSLKKRWYLYRKQEMSGEQK